MNKAERWCPEDAMGHYLDILVERVQDEGRDIQRDTLIMFSLVSMAYNIEYIEHHLAQVVLDLRKASCKKS